MATTANVYAVFGNPIHHSLSPLMHREFAKHTEQLMTYSAQNVARNEFAHAARSFFAAGGHGLNITAPFKLDAFAFADELTARAQSAGAVNTLTHVDGSIVGDNTDGYGLTYDLINHCGWSIGKKRLLILGAGGATEGILPSLLNLAPHSITITNRTPAKALHLVQKLASDRVTTCEWHALAAHRFDVIINATSAHLSNQDALHVPNDILCNGGLCYDLNYSAHDTAFMRWAKGQGALAVYDGLGMLVGQGAESFRCWRGVLPPIEPVIHYLRAILLHDDIVSE